MGNLMAKKFKSESLIRAGIVILAAQAIFLFANFFYHFISARMLGPEEYAVVASIFSIFYLISVGSAAIQNTATKFISRFRAEKTPEKEYYFFKRGTKEILAVSAALTLAYLILSPLIAGFLNISVISVIISCPAIILFALTPFNRGILQGQQKFKILGINLIIEGLTRLGLAVILIILGLKSNGAIAAVSIGSAAALIFTFPVLNLKKTAKKARLEGADIYKFAIIAFIALFFVNALYNFDIFLVKHFFSAEQAGFYATVSLLGKVIFFGATAIGLVMFPKVAEMHSKGQKIRKVYIKSMIFAVLISALAILVYFLFPEIIVSLLFGERYISISPLLWQFGVFMMLLSLSYISVLKKLAIGKKRFIANIVIALAAEIILISLFHSSLEQVILILNAVSALLFFTLLK